MPDSELITVGATSPIMNYASQTRPAAEEVAKYTDILNGVMDGDLDANGEYVMGLAGIDVPTPTILYVDPVNGIDSGVHCGVRGTTLPFETLETAYAQSQSGDTIVLRNASGTPLQLSSTFVIAQSLTIKSEGSRGKIIGPNAATVTAISVTLGAEVTLSGIDVSGARVDELTLNGDVPDAHAKGIIDIDTTGGNVLVEYCRIHDSTGSGINFTGTASSRFTARKNTIEGCFNGISVVNTTGNIAHNFVIDDNDILDGWGLDGGVGDGGHAISLHGNGTGLTSTWTNYDADYVVSNNRIGSGYSIGIEPQAGLQNGLIIGNRLNCQSVARGFLGITISGGCLYTKVVNCLSKGFIYGYECDQASYTDFLNCDADCNGETGSAGLLLSGASVSEENVGVRWDGGRISNADFLVQINGNNILNPSMANVTYDNIMSPGLIFNQNGDATILHVENINSASSYIQKSGSDTSTVVDALRIRATYADATSSLRYYFLAASPYDIVAGDVFQYEIMCDSGNPACFASANPSFDDATFLSQAQVYDQNGVHVNADISQFARVRWYARRFDLTPVIGKTLDGFYAGDESMMAGAFTTYVRRVRITDSTGLLKLSLYAGGPLAADSTSAVAVSGDSLASGIISEVPDTGWTAWTGTASKVTRATSTVTLEETAQAVKAIIDLLKARNIA